MSLTPYAFSIGAIESELRLWARERQRSFQLGPPSGVLAHDSRTRISMPSHSKQPTEQSESTLAEEWQLRILRELHKKKPRPTVEQRKLLAAQTGL